jgi:oligogalacturonide lyase
VRLTDAPGSSTLYFHDNAFSPEGDKLLFNTPNGIAVVDVAKIGSPDLKPDIVAQGRGGYFARRRREIYFTSSSSGSGTTAISAVNVDTRTVRDVAHAHALINSDESLSAVKNATAVDPDGSRVRCLPRYGLPLRIERLSRDRIRRRRGLAFERIKTGDYEHHAVHPHPVTGKRAEKRVLTR